MKDEVTRFKEISQQLEALEEKKIRIEEQFKSKKAALQELLNKIKSEGYDPTKLSEIIAEKESVLIKDLQKFEKQVKEVSEALSVVEV